MLGLQEAGTQFVMTETVNVI